MTIIGAIPGNEGCMVADQIHVTNYMVWSYEPKIKRLPNGSLVAHTGRIDGNNLIYDWYSNQEKPECLKKEGYKPFSGLLLKPNGDLWCFYSGLDYPIKSEHAVFMGAGEEFALAHYRQYGDIRRAVEFACDHSLMCGGDIDYYGVGDLEAPELDLLFKSELP